MGETLEVRDEGSGVRRGGGWNPLPASQATSESRLRESDEPGPQAASGAADLAATVSIGVGCSFEGLLTFRGTTRVDGQLLGDVIASGTLLLGETARVRGRIEVDELIVEGQLEGDVVARRRIELSPSARVVGNIESPRLSLAEGCVFRGRCRCVS